MEYIRACADMALPEDGPGLFFTEKGYRIEFLGCQYDDGLEVERDRKIDIDDYITEAETGSDETGNTSMERPMLSSWKSLIWKGLQKQM